MVPTSGLALARDSQGNLYGTTDSGGSSYSGTAFELSPRQGGWTETILHSFAGGSDGIGSTAGLILDNAGNLYGTTTDGGIYDAVIAFELLPNGQGGWYEAILYTSATALMELVPMLALSSIQTAISTAPRTLAAFTAMARSSSCAGNAWGKILGRKP